MKINFSHDYPKLWKQKKAELLAVRVIDAQAVAINKDLIEYDTKYILPDYSPDFTGGVCYYPLPKTGKLIQLIFVGDKDIPFCTLRRYIPTKYDYYKKGIGKIFEIIIGGKD